MPRTTKTPAFAEIVEQVSDESRQETMTRIDTQIDTRAEYERTQAPGNSSIQDKLKAARKKLVLPGIAGLMIAANVDPTFINRSVGGSKRFNIYAVAKLADLLHALNTGQMQNAVNLAVMKSLFRFRAAGMPFTGQAVLGAVSDKVRLEKAIADCLVRHTASPGTAPTQSSSTMNALQVLGVVRNTGTARSPVWELTDAPVTKRFEEMLAA